MNKYKKDYIALQNIWSVCAFRYLGSYSKSQRMEIIEDFHDSLIDIKEEGKQAIRSNYEKWESTVWIPFCKKKLDEWIKDNPFESRVSEHIDDEFDNIKRDHNRMRFQKIMQLIQDSGIGLGQGSSSSSEAWDYKDAVEDRNNH